MRRPQPEPFEDYSAAELGRQRRVSPSDFADRHTQPFDGCWSLATTLA